MLTHICHIVAKVCEHRFYNDLEKGKKDLFNEALVESCLANNTGIEHWPLSQMHVILAVSNCMYQEVS